MQALFKNYGDKILAFITSALALASTQQGLVSNPAVLKWVLFASALGTLAHTVFVSPTAATTLQQGTKL
jgi:hypothetical protein